jgi:hypothetical protein
MQPQGWQQSRFAMTQVQQIPPSTRNDSRHYQASDAQATAVIQNRGAIRVEILDIDMTMGIDQVH